MWVTPAALSAHVLDILSRLARGPQNVRELEPGTSLEPLVQGRLSRVGGALREYEEYLASQGVNIDHFSARELTRLKRWNVYAVPPRCLWDEMARTLIFAAEPIRELYGAPVRLYNAYRPPAYNRAVRGAKRSLHIRNAAIDILPLNPSPQERRRLALAAAAYMREHGKALNLGMGIYNYPRMTGIHIDACVRTKRTPYASTRRWMVEAKREA